MCPSTQFVSRSESQPDGPFVPVGAQTLLGKMIGPPVRRTRTAGRCLGEKDHTCGELFSVRPLSGTNCLLLALREELGVNEASQCGADDWGNPEQP